MTKPKLQSPVVEHVINAYAEALKEKGAVPQDTTERLIEILLNTGAPTVKRIEEALFPPDEDESDS